MKKTFMLLGVHVVALVALAVLVSVSVALGQTARNSNELQASAVSNAFTYQGRLKDSHGPVTDSCQMAFCLYDEDDGGNPVGEAITTTIPITDGLFMVDLDFGSEAFNGDARWLDIKVKCSADLAYTQLDRQEITATPYSLYSLSTAALQGYPITTTAPSDEQLLLWRGDTWQSTAIAVSGKYYGAPINPPVEYDLSALGEVSPSSVITVVSGFKWDGTGDTATPISVKWQVVDAPPLSLQLLKIWDIDGELCSATSAAWMGKFLGFSFIATSQ